MACGAECVVDRHDVDMEDWSVINQWLSRVCDYVSQAELRTTLDYIQHDDMTEDLFSRHRPFLATLKVCLVSCVFFIRKQLCVWGSTEKIKLLL